SSSATSGSSLKRSAIPSAASASSRKPVAHRTWRRPLSALPSSSMATGADGAWAAAPPAASAGGSRTGAASRPARAPAAAARSSRTASHSAAWRSLTTSTWRPSHRTSSTSRPPPSSSGGGAVSSRASAPAISRSASPPAARPGRRRAVEPRRQPRRGVAIAHHLDLAAVAQDELHRAAAAELERRRRGEQPVERAGDLAVRPLGDDLVAVDEVDHPLGDPARHRDPRAGGGAEAQLAALDARREPQGQAERGARQLDLDRRAQVAGPRLASGRRLLATVPGELDRAHSHEAADRPAVEAGQLALDQRAD